MSAVAQHRTETHPLCDLWTYLGANKPFWAENNENVPKHADAFTLDFARSKYKVAIKSYKKYSYNIELYVDSTLNTCEMELVTFLDFQKLE